MYCTPTVAILRFLYTDVGLVRDQARSMHLVCDQARSMHEMGLVRDQATVDQCIFMQET